MLLTKLIPPKSNQIKEALSVFNRFLEEPHENPQERLELLIKGGRGCGKSTIASGMMLKANQERGDGAICLRRSRKDAIAWDLDYVLWSAEQLGLKDKAQVSKQIGSLRLDGEAPAMFFKGFDIGLSELRNKVRGIINRRFLWIEDAQEIENEEEYGKILDAVDLRENPIIILTYHPPCSQRNWLNKYAEEIRASQGKFNRWVFNPCYLNMEKEMLGEQFFEGAEYVRLHSPREFVQEYLGIPQEL